MLTDQQRYNELARRRSELKQKDRIIDAIAVQLKIVELARVLEEPAKHLPNAWNMLARLYDKSQQYVLAENAARNSIATWDASSENPEEALATYKFLLARILAAVGRIDEAITIGDQAIKHFSVFHSPPTAFLTDRIQELNKIRSFREGTRINEG